jgi:hypothetical protein
MYCEDCGCKVYNGHCTNCHEETYIAEQNANMENTEDMIAFSPAFIEKVEQQKEEAKEIIKNKNDEYKERKL